MSGYEVTLLEMQDKLAPDASPFYRDGMSQLPGYAGLQPAGLLQLIEENRNLRYFLNACCIGISNGAIYRDAKGTEHKLEAGTVVIAAGMKPRIEETLSLNNPAYRLLTVGDCSRPGSVENAMRTAFGAAVTL
jgi:hypothetical protein